MPKKTCIQRNTAVQYDPSMPCGLWAKAQSMISASSALAIMVLRKFSSSPDISTPFTSRGQGEGITRFAAGGKRAPSDRDQSRGEAPALAGEHIVGAGGGRA